MDAAQQRRVIEALILAASEPISAARLADIVPGCTPGVAKDRVNELNTEYQEQDRAFEIWEVAGGYQIRTRAEFSGYLQQLRKERPLRLSRAALETLAIVAYKQPVTRADIEQVRGVEAGAVVKGLLDRKLVKMLGHKEVPGRPMLYGTSRRFLEVFGLESLDRLPSLRELEEIAREQNIELPGMTPVAEGAEADAAAPAEEGEPADAVVGAEEAAEGDLAPEPTDVLAAWPGEDRTEELDDAALDEPEIVIGDGFQAAGPEASDDDACEAAGDGLEEGTFAGGADPEAGAARYAAIEIPPVDEDGADALSGFDDEADEEPDPDRSA